jgi:hypothetical protein
MKKNLGLGIFLLICTLSAEAQRATGQASNNDRTFYAGYSIRLIPTSGNSYGYDIFLKNKLVVHQSVNPFTLAPTGLRSKEDAFKIAQWQTQQIRQMNGRFVVKNQLISKDIARKLDIAIN